MTDVLLTHSYFLRFDPKEFRAMMPYPPLGTMIAANHLRGLGYSVALFDSMLARTEQEIIPLIEKHRPSVVVIYDDDFNYLTKMCLSRMREAAFVMSRLAKERGCTVVVHGSDPADHAAEYLDHGADAVIVGEGEITLGEYIEHVLRHRGSGAAINGLVTTTNGTLTRTPPRKVLHDLDTLPFAAWDLIDVDAYRSAWRDRHGYFSVNMVTTRGCPFHCNWCAKPLYGQVYNSRSPENVVDEMLLLRKTVRPDHLWFCDDIFGLKPGWVAAFSDEVRRRDAVIPFKCLSRVDLLLNDTTIADLHRAGCTTVWVGAESGSQKILDAMEKGTTVAQIREATRRMHAEGIRVGFFLQYGYPGETRSDIELTLGMVRECRPDEIGISVSYPLPGTKFHSMVREQLGAKHNWTDSEDLDMMFAGTYSTEFYRALHTVTHKKFRLWQAAEILRTTMRHPTSIRAGSLRRLGAAAYHFVTLPRYQRAMEACAATPRLPV